MPSRVTIAEFPPAYKRSDGLSTTIQRTILRFEKAVASPFQ
jgi:hypothetical protein